MADAPKTHRRLRKVLMILAAVLAAVVALVIIFVPFIADSVAPGMIADRASKSIKGSVKVASVKTGWRGPTVIKGIELLDEQGKPVATLEATSTLGILDALGSMKDLGTVLLKGRVDLVRTVDANGRSTTNLQRAVAPRDEATKPAPGGSTPNAPNDHIAELTAKIEFLGLDVAYAERTAQGGGQLVNQAAMKNLVGVVDVSTKGTGKADVKLDAAFADSIDATPGARTGAMHVDASVKNLIGASGKVQLGTLAIDRFEAKLGGAPTKLLDALLSQHGGGVLPEALGPTADLTVSAKGVMPVVSADVKLASDNAEADLALESRDGRVVSTRPGSATLRTLAFAKSLPSVRDALAKANITIDDNAWPGFKLTLQSFNLPADPNGNGWGGGGSKLELNAFTTADIRGSIRRTPQSAPEAMVIKPVTISFLAPDLAKGAEVIGNTAATIGGQSAGDLDLLLSLGDLVGVDGKLSVLNKGLPSRVGGKLTATRVATGLLTPFFAGTPIEPVTDFGPTLDVTINAAPADGSVSVPGQNPPTVADFTARASNLDVSGRLVLNPTGIEAAGGIPVRITMSSAGPMLARIAASHSPGVSVSGVGRLEASIENFRLPVIGSTISTELASAHVLARVRDLAASPANSGVTLGVDDLRLDAEIIPRQPTPLKIAGTLLLNSQPAAVDATLKLDGLLNPVERTPLATLGELRLAGAASFTNLNGRAVQQLLLKPESPAALRDLAAQMLGDSLNIEMKAGTGEYAVAQPLSFLFSGSASRGTVALDLKPDALDLRELDLTTTVTPGVARSVLAMIGQKPEAMADIALREATELGVALSPLSVPLKPGSLEPILGKSNQLVTVAVALKQPAIVDGLVVEGRRLSAGVANFTANGSLPLALLGSDAERAAVDKPSTFTATSDIIGTNAADVLGRFNLNLSTTPGGEGPRISIGGTELITARLDDIIGKPGLLNGLLGDKAEIVAGITGPTQREPKRIIALDLRAPRLRADKLQITHDGETLRLLNPFNATWTADPAFIERYLFTPAPGRTPALRMITGAPGGSDLRLEIRALTLTAPKTINGIPHGPIKPGVFTLQGALRAESLSFLRAGSDSPTELKGLTVIVNSTPTPGVAFDATITAIRDHAAEVTRPTNVTGSLEHIADTNGNLDLRNSLINLDATAPNVPTALVDSITKQNGELVKLLGPELSAKIKAVNVPRGQALAGAGGVGNVAVDLRSPKATVIASGPVHDGVWDMAAPNASPLKLELTDFQYEAGGKLLKLFPMLATLSRQSNEFNKVPSIIAAKNLRVPVDGDWSKFNGDIDVNVGRVDYTFSESFGEILDATIFRGGRGLDQRPVPAFTIQIRNGVATYGSIENKIALPVRNLDFLTRGRVDFVTRQIDVITYVPTASAAPGLLQNANKAIGGFLGKLIPNAVEQLTSIPIRTSGPLDNPSTSFAPDVTAAEFGDRFKNLGNTLKDTIKGIIPGLNKPKDEKPK